MVGEDNPSIARKALALSRQFVYGPVGTRKKHDGSVYERS